MRKVFVKAECPKCGEEISVEVDPGKLLVSLRKNPGRNGGRPKGAKDKKPRKRNGNGVKGGRAKKRKAP